MTTAALCACRAAVFCTFGCCFVTVRFLFQRSYAAGLNRMDILRNFFHGPVPPLQFK